jgi:hypothetical protein
MALKMTPWAQKSASVTTLPSVLRREFLASVPEMRRIERAAFYFQGAKAGALAKAPNV